MDFIIDSYWNLCYLVGIILALRTIVQILYSVYPWVTAPINLSEKYGPGSWALITGGSDGIGLAFTRKFAKAGFNIVIIARTLSKLERVAEGIRSEFGVQVRVIAADFS